MSKHNLRKTDEGWECVDCWQVRANKETFQNIECKSFSFKGPSMSQTEEDKEVRDCPMCGSRWTGKIDEETGTCFEEDCGVSFPLG